MKPQIKPKRVIDRKYREWIKRKPCLVMSRSLTAQCEGPIDPHHIIPIGGGIMGSKVSDRRCIPLCRFHHESCHSLRDRYDIQTEAEIRSYNLEYDALFPEKPARERKPSPNIIVKRAKWWAVINGFGRITMLFETKSYAEQFLRRNNEASRVVRVEIRGAK